MRHLRHSIYLNPPKAPAITYSCELESNIYLLK